MLRRYLNSKILTFYRSPTQLLQLAINEPDTSSISQAAYSVLDSLEVSYVDWVTKPQDVSKCVATLQLGTVVHCTAVSPSGDLLALGADDCRIHVYMLATCEVSALFVVYTFISELFLTPINA